jgi:hypothetical protein
MSAGSLSPEPNPSMKVRPPSHSHPAMSQLPEIPRLHLDCIDVKIADIYFPRFTASRPAAERFT